MTIRISNVVLGVLAVACGAAGGSLWASGDPHAAPAVEVAVSPAAVSEAEEPSPCCRKGQKKCCAGNGGAARAGLEKKAAPATITPAVGGKAAKSVETTKATFVCPMHPEVTSTRREDRCPKCGMFLEAAAK